MTLLERLQAATKPMDDALAAVPDPDGLLELAEKARQKADKIVNGTGGRTLELPGLDDPRWKDVERARNAPKLAIEEQRQITLALSQKFPEPAQQQVALGRLEAIQTKRAEIKRAFKL